MSDHRDLIPMIEKTLANHRMRKGPGMSWRLGAPGSWSHGFFVTWTPGTITVSGDLDNATYGLRGSLWDVILLINGSGWDYLTGKSSHQQKFDREASIAQALHLADEYMKDWEDFQFWEKLVRYYLGANENARNGAIQMQAAAKFRQRMDSADEMYRIFGDAEMIVYSYDSQTRWQYEALRLWARKMIAAEPPWHQMWRALMRGRAYLEDLRRYPPIFQPALYAAGQAFNGSRYWIRKEWVHNGEPGVSYQSVHPWRIAGLDLSTIGFWRNGGSNWPTRTPQEEERFKPIGREVTHA